MDPRNQTFFLQGPDGQTHAVWLPLVDSTMSLMAATSINYGSQIGACIVMTAVLLTMTSRTRFGRASLLINLSSLLLGILRNTLLALYFTSSYVEFYTLFAHDYNGVHRRDTNISVTATFLGAPQLMLIEAALALQLYALVRIWPPAWKAALVGVSALLVVPAVAFRLMRVVVYMRSTFEAAARTQYIWVLQYDVAFSTTTVFWFCFVFLARLVAHMWTYRSILPPIGHLSAMEVLVMTNGVLMIIPVVFTGLAFDHLANFESGSVSLTAVAVVLPLGTLIAQHMTAKAPASSSNKSGASSGAAGGSTAGHRPTGQGGTGGDSATRKNDNGNGESGNTRARNVGMDSCSSIKTTASHRRLLGSWSRSDANAFVPSGQATQVSIQSTGSSGGGHGGGRGGGFFAKSKAPLDAVDHELQLIDMEGNEGNNAAHDRGVWVNREIEVHQGTLV